MDILKVLSELQEERSNIDAAIIALERLARGTGRRRGRPPKWMAVSALDEEAGAPDQTKKRKFSIEARKRMAEAQRKRWASRAEKSEGASTVP